MPGGITPVVGRHNLGCVVDDLTAQEGVALIGFQPVSGVLEGTEELADGRAVRRDRRPAAVGAVAYPGRG